MNRIHSRWGIAVLGVLMAAVAVACGTDATATPTQGGGGQQPTPTADEGFDAEEYFSGRTITFVTSSGLDGGTGVQLQYLADAINEFLPGNPETTIRSQQPHVAGINLLWNSPNDGFTLGYISHDPMREEDFSEAQHTTADFTFIGDVGVDVNVFMTLSELGYTDIEDLKGSAGSGRPQVVMAAQAPNPLDIENAVLGWMLAAEWLQYDLRINAVAETATSQQILDIERGNQNANEWGGGAWFLIGESHENDGRVCNLQQLGRARWEVNCRTAVRLLTEIHPRFRRNSRVSSLHPRSAIASNPGRDTR